MAPTNKDLLSLIATVLGGGATPEQVQQLNDLLESDSQAVELFTLFSQQEVDLRHVLKTDCVHAMSGKRLAGAGSAARSANVVEKQPLITHFMRRMMPVLAAAAMLLVLIAAIQRSLPPDKVAKRADSHASIANDKIVPAIVTKPPAPVAVLTSESGAVWQGPKIFRGQSLREGDAVTLVKGELRISMGFGAEIAAKGPCALRIIARDRVQLEFGEVAVHVADWAHGFVVETPTMEVVDLGTTFVVSASRNESVEASVIKGQVRVNPRQVANGSPRTILVSEGESLLVERTGRQTNLPLKPEGLIDFGSEHPFRPIGLHNSGFGFGVGEEDPNWRVVAGPTDATFSGPQFAAVCVPDERYMANDPKSSQWVSMTKWRAATPLATYTFETKFDLTGFDLSTVRLFGRFLADNGIKEVRVNGKPVILESWVDNARGQYFSLPQFRTVNVTSGLVPGVNTIQIDVLNGRIYSPNDDSTVPNPVALRVEWEGFGRPARAPSEGKSKASQKSPLEAEKSNDRQMSANTRQHHCPT
jgi:hypothetical protein